MQIEYLQTKVHLNSECLPDYESSARTLVEAIISFSRAISFKF